MRYPFALAGLCMCLVFLSCSSNQESTDSSTPLRKVSKKPFSPPADSLITPEQMKSWLACNPLLDSLSFLYQDSFSTSDKSRHLQYQNDFSLAQDRICVIAGLSGGYQEYLWILRNSTTPRNRPLLDSLGITLD